MQDYLLSTLLFLPIIASTLVLFVPTAWQKTLKIVLISILSIELVLAFYALSLFDTQLKGLQLVERQVWIYLSLGSLGNLLVEYFIALDGFNAGFIALTALVMWIGGIASLNIDKHFKGYVSLYLLLTGSLMGCFVALDFLLFYLFFEFMLLPMYFLIGIWGGERKEYASIKFFIYTLIGSLFILVVIIGLYLSVVDLEKTAYKQKMIGSLEEATPKILQKIVEDLKNNQIPAENIVHSFSIPAMMRSYNYLPTQALHYQNPYLLGGYSLRFWAFLLLFLGFAIKLPIVPLHTWLPDAHVEAPTPVSVVLAGILLKVGGYGILRTAYSIFPDIALQSSFWIACTGVGAIVYAGLVALGQQDLKKMIAYSSVSHMGFVLLGIASLTDEGINGAIFQMISHGILSAMLFIIVGVLYDRTHNRQIDAYRGLYSQMPRYTSFVIIAFFASLGLPTFSGFIGELFTLIGGFKATAIPAWLSSLAVVGILIGAGYFLWTLQGMFLGQFWYKHLDTSNALAFKDLNPREMLMLTCLACLTLILGIFPSIIFRFSEIYTKHWLDMIWILKK